jgi:hypothetical protein
MRKKTQAPWLPVLLLGISIITGAQSQELRKERKGWVGEINKTFKVKDGGILVMDEIRGDVTIQAEVTGEVSVHEIKKMDIFSKQEAEAAMKESEKGYIQEGNRIRIGGEAFDKKWIYCQFKIIVPKNFNCEIKTKGGDLSITGVDGKVKAATGGGDIELEQIGGIVSVATGGGDIQITKTTKEVNATTGGGDVEITASNSSVKVATGGGNIKVIDTQDEVIVTTGGGDVEIKGTMGRVKVTTGGGEIDIIKARGNVSATTGGGDIEIQDVTGDFQANTGGGDIDAQEVSGAVHLNTGGGDIQLIKLHGPIEVNTGGGDITAELVLADFSKDHPISLRTGGGNIDLTIPAKLPATIEAEIKFRKKSWEDYKINSDFPLKTTTEDEDSKYRIIRATGDINGGGDLIELKSGGGNIQIRSSK